MVKDITFNSVVEAVFDKADKDPDKLALADDNNHVTYKEYKDQILRYSAVLLSLGIEKNDKVTVEACQSIDYLTLELAVQLIGAVFVPFENNCANEKAISFRERVNSKFIVSKKEYEGLNYSYNRLNELAVNVEPYKDYVFPAKDDVSEILFSTGTTGKEKGIVLTHKNDIALASNVIHGVEMEEDNVEMIPSPLNHSHGLRRYYANMVKGATVIILGSVMNIKKFFRNLDEYKVNSMDMVPTALSVVLKLSKNRLGDYKDRIRYIQLGAAPLIKEDKEKICALLPDSRLYNFYGSTESGCIVIYNFNKENAKDNCIGKAAVNAEIIVVDENRNVIESSKEKTGLLACKGDMNMSGYWEDKEETEKVLADGIIYTNDEVYFDDDGDIILLGRKGDVINSAGNKIAPEEIENAARKIEGIKDAACIGIYDKTRGSVPKLFVVMDKGYQFDKSLIRKSLGEMLEPYKVPAVIEEINEIPRTFNGKILRRELH